MGSGPADGQLGRSGRALHLNIIWQLLGEDQKIRGRRCETEVEAQEKIECLVWVFKGGFFKKTQKTGGALLTGTGGSARKEGQGDWAMAVFTWNEKRGRGHYPEGEGSAFTLGL